MSRELMKPSPGAVAVRHPNGRVSTYQDTHDLIGVNVPPVGGRGQVETTMTPRGALDLWQALTKLIDSDSELRVLAGREDPEAVAFSRVNGLDLSSWGPELLEGS